MINLGHCGEPCPVATTTWQKDEDSQQVEDTPFGEGGNDGAHANIPAHLKPPRRFQLSYHCGCQQSAFPQN